MKKLNKQMIERRRLLKLVGGGIAFASLPLLAGCSDGGTETTAKEASPKPASPAPKPAAKAEPAAAPATVESEAAPHLAEDNPQAQALGYQHETSMVDSARFPQHNADQACSNCALYTGKAGDAWGPCGIFAGKQVSANGWCSAYVRKA